jgi:hypothetical protein
MHFWLLGLSGNFSIPTFYIHPQVQRTEVAQKTGLN